VNSPAAAAHDYRLLQELRNALSVIGTFNRPVFTVVSGRKLDISECQQMALNRIHAGMQERHYISKSRFDAMICA
jgi:hypothetical protein